MIHRNLRYLAGWEWHVLQLKHISVASQRRQKVNNRSITQSLQNADERYSNEKKELASQYPEAASWINESYERFTNHIVIQKVDGFGQVVHGTILIQLSEDDADITPLHFWLSSSKLILMQRDTRIPLKLQHLHMLEEYEQCQHAPEAFFVMLSLLLESLHVGLDQYEQRLGVLEKDMRERNRKDLLDTIIERRYELLHYSHLYLPIRELEGLAKEAFLHTLTDSRGFQRMEHRFQRIDQLLKHYAVEIDTLISVDDALSNFKGNEIVRTLTIFAAICLPATIIGALWGTNFLNLPFRNEPLGFLYMLGTIIIVTCFIYFLLWRKGWTGDILHKHNNVRNATNEKLHDVILKQADVSLEQQKEQPLPSRKNRHTKKHTPAIQASIHEQISLAEDKPLPSRKRR